MTTWPKRAQLDNDRFCVTRRALGTGPDSIKGIDVWSARTRIAAGPVIEALGLAGEIKHNEARDSNDYLLYSGEKSEHQWRGFTVEPRFRRRAPGASDGPYSDYELAGVSLMP